MQISTEEENIRSTRQEDVSMENSPGRNRININGMVDPQILTKLELNNKIISDEENFRESIKQRRFNIQGLSEKKNFMAGRSENEELAYIGEVADESMLR